MTTATPTSNVIDITHMPRAYDTSLELDWGTDIEQTDANRMAIAVEATQWADDKCHNAYRGRVFFDYRTDQLRVIVQSLHGPAGGWPIVRFDGPAPLIGAIASAFEDDANGVS